MTYEQWTATQNAVSAGALIAFVIVGVVTYVMSRRPKDDQGKRKGRPWLAALAGAASFLLVGISGTATLMVGYPEHYARYDQEHGVADEQAHVAADDNSEATRQENLRACMNACPDAPMRCGVIDADRCEARQRAMFACTNRCGERFGQR